MFKLSLGINPLALPPSIQQAGKGSLSPIAQAVEPKDEVSYSSFRIKNIEERVQSGTAGVQRATVPTLHITPSHLLFQSSEHQGWGGGKKVVISTDLKPHGFASCFP